MKEKIEKLILDLQSDNKSRAKSLEGNLYQDERKHHQIVYNINLGTIRKLKQIIEE